METDDAGVYHFPEISVHPRRGYPVLIWEMDAVPFVVACGWLARWGVYVKHGKMVHSRGGGVGYARREVFMSVVRIESMGEGVRIMWRNGTLSDGRG